MIEPLLVILITIEFDNVVASGRRAVPASKGSCRIPADGEIFGGVGVVDALVLVADVILESLGSEAVDVTILTPNHVVFFGLSDRRNGAAVAVVGIVAAAEVMSGVAVIPIIPRWIRRRVAAQLMLLLLQLLELLPLLIDVMSRVLGDGVNDRQMSIKIPSRVKRFVAKMTLQAGRGGFLAGGRSRRRDG